MQTKHIITTADAGSIAIQSHRMVTMLPALSGDGSYNVTIEQEPCSENVHDYAAGWRHVGTIQVEGFDVYLLVHDCSKGLKYPLEPGRYHVFARRDARRVIFSRTA